MSDVRMENPWVALPESGDLVLAVDAQAVQRHNQRATDAHRLRLDLGPEPFIGRPDAPVVILMGNPGYSELDIEAYADPAFAQAARSNLQHRLGAFPNFLLDPSFAWTSGGQWWRRHLRRVIEVVGDQRASEGILVLETIPYHSRRFRALDVPSQRYTYELLRAAVERRSVIVHARGSWPEWALPAGYPRVRLRNRQRVWVTPGNLEDDGFTRLIAALG